MSGIIAVYSLVIAVLIAEDMRPPTKEGSSYSLFKYVSHPLVYEVLLNGAGSILRIHFTLDIPLRFSTWGLWRRTLC
jgi:hypothetical protein